MKTKVVYSIISKVDDFYVEQALVSMYSIRYYNPEIHIVVITDEITMEGLIDKRARIKEFVDEFIIVNIPMHYNDKERSRFIKTSIRQNIDGDYLYIDNDTIIVSSLEEIDELKCDIGAVLDSHLRLDLHKEKIKSNLDGYINKTKKIIYSYPLYFNSGIMYVKDNDRSKKLYDKWHNIWISDNEQYDISIDQPALFQANIANNMIIQELDGNYNCQILIPAGAKYLINPKIIHYYSSSKLVFPLSRPDILREVRDKGITKDILYIIEHPLISFIENSHIIGEEDFQLYRSPMGLLGRKLSRDYVWTNKIAKMIYGLFGHNIEC